MREIIDTENHLRQLNPTFGVSYKEVKVDSNNTLSIEAIREKIQEERKFISERRKEARLTAAIKAAK